MGTDEDDQDGAVGVVVPERDDDEDERIVRRQDDGESHISGGRGLARGAVAGQEAHDQPNVVAGDVQEVAFLDVRPAAQPGSAHAATIEDQGEAALAELGAELEGRLGDAGQEAGAVVVDGSSSGVIAAPAADLGTAAPTFWRVAWARGRSVWAGRTSAWPMT